MVIDFTEERAKRATAAPAAPADQAVIERAHAAALELAAILAPYGCVAIAAFRADRSIMLALVAQDGEP